MTDGKQLFLVDYDYGTGGLWGLMLARSEEEIKRKYPGLGIAHERPHGMTQERHDQLRRSRLYDIDDPPSGILDALLAQRERD